MSMNRHTHVNTGGELARHTRHMSSEAVKPLRELPMAPQVPQPRVISQERNVTLETLRALSHPLRLELISHIAARGPICTCHLEESLPYTQPTTAGSPSPRRVPAQT